jgi:hypothetical protein
VSAEPTGPGRSGAAPEGLADSVARLARAPGEKRDGAAEHRTGLRDLTATLRHTGQVGSRWFADAVIDVAERLPVRDLATLQRHHDGRTGEALAEALVATAARNTATVGAVGGTLATAEFISPPALLGAPVQIVAETLVIVAIELKLVAELHAVYGVPVTGPASQRAVAYVGAWSRRTAVDRLGPVAVTGAARRQLQSRLVRRLARTSTTLAPLFAGAIAGAVLSRRETLRVGRKVSADLRKRAR